MYNLFEGNKNSDGFWIGFHRDIESCEQELSSIKRAKGSYQVNNFVKHVFCFTEHQEDGKYRLKYSLTLQ